MRQRVREQGEAPIIDPVGQEESSARLAAVPASQPSPWARLGVRCLKLSPATNHALERFGHTTIDQIVDLSDAQLLQNPHLTPKGVAEIRSALGQFAHQPATLAAASTTKSRPTPTDELASRPVLPYTDWSQSTTALTTTSGPTAETSSSLPPSRSNTARELGLSATTTQAQQEHEGSTFPLPVFPGGIDFVDPDTGKVSRRRIEENSTACFASTMKASATTRAAAFRNAEDLQGTSSQPHPPAKILSAQPSPTLPTDDLLPVPVGELGFSEQTILALYERGIFTLGYFADPANLEIPFLKSLNPTVAAEVWEALSFLYHISAAIVAELDMTENPPTVQRQTFTAGAPLDELNLPKRCYNALMRAGYDRVEQLLDMDDDELLEVRNLGRQSLADLRDALNNYLTNHPDQGPARFIETGPWGRDRVKGRFFRPAHDSLAQGQQKTWVMMLESGQSWDAVGALDLELRARHLPSLVPLPDETIVGRESVGFLLRLGCPLAEISTARLTISKSARDHLQRTGLMTALRVFLADRTQLQETFTADTFEALISDVCYYVQWLSAQSDWTDEVQRRRPSPTAFFHLAQENWEGLLQGFLDTLDERERRVLNLRFAVDGGPGLSMQEVADQLILTRSRIQQIEAKALRKLQERINQHEVLGAFVWLCQEAIKDARIVSASALLVELSEYLPPDSSLTRGQVMLLIEGVNGCARYQKDTDVLMYAPTRIEVSLALDNIRRILRTAGAPIRFPDLVRVMQQSTSTGQQADADLIRACLQAIPDFVNVEGDFWGLESWERHIGDDLVMILRRLGRSAHFTELAKELNGRLPDDTRKSERNVLAHLQRMTNLFVRTGPGTFGLRESHSDLPDRPTKYVDLIEQVLQEAGHPLQIDEVFSLVNERREAKRSSIQMYLGMDPRFTKTGPAQYGLATWRDTTQQSHSTQVGETGACGVDDFTYDLAQRVRQWLEHDS